jgi:uncharacterized membrane protein
MTAATSAPASPGLRAALSAAAGVVLTVVYLVLCHRAVDSGSAWAPWLMLLPVSATLVGAAALRFGRWAGVGVALAVIGVMAWSQPWLRLHGGWLYVAEHVGFNLALASLFGLSLSDPRGALITRLAQRVRGKTLPAGVATYTRRATLAWALAFCAIAAVSIGLFLWAPIGHWSLFANLLTAPLIGVLFVAEYIVRRLTLRHIDHSGFLDGYRAFQAHRAEPAQDGATPADAPLR